MVKVITLTGTLAYTGKYGISTVLCCDVTNQLLDQNGFTYTCTAEESDFTTLLIGAEQIDNLDTGLEKLGLGSLFFESGSRFVDRLIAYSFGSGLIVDRFSEDVKNSAQCVLSDRNRNRSAGGNCFHAAHQTVRRTHGDTSYDVVT